MPNKSIIPRSIKPFYNYLVQTCAYLILGVPTNAVRFNWTAANLTAWQNFLSQFTPLYNQYTNKKAGYTTDIKDKLMAIIANAVLYARANKLIELIKATVSINTTDCNTFKLPVSLAVASTSTHSVARSKITDITIITKELVYPEIIPIGGGILHIKGYCEEKQSGRPHKPEGFDELQYAIGVFYSTATGLPISYNDARLTKDYSTKSNFKLQTDTLTANLTAIPAGQATPLKVAVIFFRWAKSKHPTLDGP